MLLFYLNKIKDKQENQVAHTYKLIGAKNVHGSDKMKEGEDRHHQMISFRELLPCVLLCLPSK